MNTCLIIGNFVLEVKIPSLELWLGQRKMFVCCDRGTKSKKVRPLNFLTPAGRSVTKPQGTCTRSYVHMFTVSEGRVVQNTIKLIQD